MLLLVGSGYRNDDSETVAGRSGENANFGGDACDLTI